MIRFTLIAASALAMAAAPVLAQTAPASTAQPVPGSEEWLRLRGEMYRAAPDSEQDPAELAATARLNAEIAARNAAAARAAQAQWERDQAAWEVEMAACRRAGRICVPTPPTGY